MFTRPMKLAFSFEPYLTKKLSFKAEKCSGRNIYKERVTILFCANIAEQKALFVLEKAVRLNATKDIINEWRLHFDHFKFNQLEFRGF